MIDRTRLLPIAAASCLALGCGAEVGKDYTGEVLLQFSGSVAYDAPIPDDSVLVLTYRNDNGDILLIDGLIEGKFPSAFRFSTTQLPPAVKDQDLAGDGKPLRVAVFGLAVVPANHAASVKMVHGTMSPPEYLSATQAHVTRTLSLSPDAQDCAGGPGCFTQDLTCQVTPCQILVSEGDASIKTLPNITGLWTGMYSTRWIPSDTGHYSSSIICDGLTAGRCLREVYRCETAGFGKNDMLSSVSGFATDRILKCVANKETGDATLQDQNLLGGVKSNFTIVWIERDLFLNNYDLKAGYNIVKSEDSLAAWLDSSKCFEQGALAVMAAYNAAHGTDYPPFISNSNLTRGNVPQLDPATREEIDRLMDPMWGECVQNLGEHVVKDPTKENLAIEIVHTFAP